MKTLLLDSTKISFYGTPIDEVAPANERLLQHTNHKFIFLM